jgi:molecular chaperone DnaJ
VPPDADSDTIKRAFRTHARALHPDVSQDPAAPERFRELTEAYGVLSKPTTRLLYDRFGYRGRGNGWFTPEGARAATDFLRRRARPVAEVLVNEHEARRGVRREVRWAQTDPCAACNGEGGAPGATATTCPGCEGTGRRRVEGSLEAGERLLQIEDCTMCAGRGVLVSEACPACLGSGVSTETVAEEVEVPQGAVDGDRVPVGDSNREVAVVRVLDAPEDRPLVRYLAVLGLLAALVFLWILLR